MEAVNAIVAMKRLKSNVALAGAQLVEVDKAENPKAALRSLEQVRSRLQVALKNVDALLPVKVAATLEE